MTPHLYQQEILSDVRRGMDEFRKILVVSPTGSGKTAMFSWLCEDAVKAGQRALVLVDQDELVWQAINKIKQFTGIDAQPEKAEFSADKSAQVVVATVQSMRTRLDEWAPNHFYLVIADEADRSVTAQWSVVLKHFDTHARVVGFTATPNRADHRNLGCYYEQLIERENLYSLIDKGFLSPFRVVMLPIKIDLSGLSAKRGDFDENELDDVLGPHLQSVAQAIKDIAPFRKTLVFLPLVKTAERFAEIARGLGLLAESVHGKSVDREEKLKRFSSGEFDILSNSLLLTRGYDEPSVDNLVPLRPTRSTTLYQQMVGRATRLAKGKSDFLLMDPLYQSPKHLVCRPANLIAKTDEQAEAITKLAEAACAGMPADVAAQVSLDLRALANDATAQREEALRRKLDEHKNKRSKTVSAEEFALAHRNLDLAEYEPVMKWESASISERQQKYLKQAKIDLSTVRGRGHASKLLDIYFADKKPRPVSQNTIELMKRMGGLCRQIGIYDLNQVNQAQVGAFFRALKTKKQNEQRN